MGVWNAAVREGREFREGELADVAEDFGVQLVLLLRPQLRFHLLFLLQLQLLLRLLLQLHPRSLLLRQLHFLLQLRFVGHCQGKRLLGSVVAFEGP